MIDEFILKLTICLVLVIAITAAIKIASCYLVNSITRAKYCRGTKDRNKLEEKKIKQQLELEDILQRGDLRIYYSQARDLFHDAIQDGNLNHEQILYLKKVIDDTLGEYLNDFKYTRYKNDAHEIYSKLKSSHISIDNFKRIIQLIKSFEAQSEGEYITIVKTKE
jgi:hypothetical protein